MKPQNNFKKNWSPYIDGFKMEEDATEGELMIDLY